jgi:hypothetical protein
MKPSVRVSLSEETRDMTSVSAIVMVPRVDAMTMNIDDDDEFREELDWVVNVANEERIEGAVEMGNADPPVHMHHHRLSHYCRSKRIRKCKLTE